MRSGGQGLTAQSLGLGVEAAVGAVSSGRRGAHRAVAGRPGAQRFLHVLFQTLDQILLMLLMILLKLVLVLVLVLVMMMMMLLLLLLQVRLVRMLLVRVLMRMHLEVHLVSTFTRKLGNIIIISVKI